MALLRPSEDQGSEHEAPSQIRKSFWKIKFETGQVVLLVDSAEGHIVGWILGFNKFQIR